MSVKSAIIGKAFGGRENLWSNLLTGDGVPAALVPIGTLYWDYTNEDAYIATDAAGTWVKINA